MRDSTASLNIRKNVVFAVLAFGINIGLVFLSYRLVILQSGLEILGLWSTLYAWTNMIRIGDVGMANASLRFIALCDQDEDQVRLRSYLETGVISNAIFYLVLGFAGYAVLAVNMHSLVEPKFVEEAGVVLPVMMTGFVLQNISGVFLGSLQGLHLGYINSQLSVVGNVVQIIFVVILVQRIGLAGLAWAQVLQYGLSIVVAWLLVRRKLKIPSLLPTAFSKTAFFEMLNFSVKAQVANVANGLFEPLSKILVGHFGGMHVLGTYELAYKTLWLPRTAIVSGSSAMIPAMTSIAKNDIRDIRKLHRRSEKLVTWLVALASVGATLISPLISMLWIGSVENRYTIFVGILAVGIIFNAWGATAYNLGLVSGNMKNNIVVNVATLCLLFILTFCAFEINASASLSVLCISTALAVGGVAIRLLNVRDILYRAKAA